MLKILYVLLCAAVMTSCKTQQYGSTLQGETYYGVVKGNDGKQAYKSDPRIVRYEVEPYARTISNGNPILGSPTIRAATNAFDTFAQMTGGVKPLDTLNIAIEHQAARAVGYDKDNQPVKAVVGYNPDGAPVMGTAYHLGEVFDDAPKFYPDYADKTGQSLAEDLYNDPKLEANPIGKTITLNPDSFDDLATRNIEFRAENPYSGASNNCQDQCDRVMNTARVLDAVEEAPPAADITN